MLGNIFKIIIVDAGFIVRLFRIFKIAIKSESNEYGKSAYIVLGISKVELSFVIGLREHDPVIDGAIHE